jgi:predicted aconitase/predicted aconitase with swiveling domain
MVNLVDVRIFSGTAYVHGKASGDVVASDLELSFWGGVDPRTGEVIDRHHPLSGRCLKDHILAIPGGRGSCSGSGVMLELLLNGKGPKAMLFEREEDILTLGVVIAEEVFGQSIPVVTLTPENFRKVVSSAFVEIDVNVVSCSADGLAMDAIPAHSKEPGHLFGEVELSERDRAYLAGDHGKAAQSAIRIILRMAKLQGATQLMDVSQVHVDGCIYTGPGSLSFAEKLRDLGGRVVVPTTLNSISVDHRRWRSQGIDPVLGEPASKLGDVYVEMGARPTFTCAPYLLETAPKIGEQVAWAESNAVIYANSVLGARTMKYPDFLDICIALTGRAPLAGPHIDINRKAGLVVSVGNIEDIDDSFYPLLGYHIGALASNLIPVVTGLDQARPTNDDLKAFGAAFATVSSAPMFHIVGVTPEATTLDAVMPAGISIPSIDLRLDELASSWEELNSADEERVDLVSLGNPHFSLSEIERLASLCTGRKKHVDVAVVVTCGRATHDKANEAGLVADLESFGVQFVTDTCWCMITDPIIPTLATTILTNSGKYAHYGPGITGRRFYFGGIAACVAAACSGVHSKTAPGWLLRD